MSLFGAHTFGPDSPFGSTFESEPIPVFRVDWHKQGFISVVDGPLMSYYSKAGRKYFLNSSGDGFEEDDTGTIEVALSNLDRRYTWSNEESDLYPNVQSGKRFELGVHYGYSFYPIAQGKVIDITDSTDEKGSVEVRIKCEDDWAKLRGKVRSITLPLMEGVYADDVINAVLDAAGWTGGRDIQAGVDVSPYWWAEGESAAELVYGIAHAELGSCYIKGDGTFVFRTRYDRAEAEYTLGAENIDINSLRTTKPSENVRTLVTCAAQPIYLTGVTTLFTLTGTITLGTSPDNKNQELWGDYTYNSVKCSAKDCIVPQPGTDYAAIDGNGVDQTAGVTVTATFLSSRFKLTISNNSGVSVSVTVQVRGKALALGSSVTFEKSDPDSIYEPAELNFSSKWLQNVNGARQLCTTLFNILREPRLIHTFSLVPDDYGLMFSMMLGRRGSVDAEETSIFGSYKVIQLIQQYDASDKAPFQTAITLEPIVAVVAPGGGGSTVPLTIPFTAGG